MELPCLGRKKSKQWLCASPSSLTMRPARTTGHSRSHAPQPLHAVRRDAPDEPATASATPNELRDLDEPSVHDSPSYASPSQTPWRDARLPDQSPPEHSVVRAEHRTAPIQPHSLVLHLHDSLLHSGARPAPADRPAACRPTCRATTGTRRACSACGRVLTAHGLLPQHHDFDAASSLPQCRLDHRPRDTDSPLAPDLGPIRKRFSQSRLPPMAGRGCLLLSSVFQIRHGHLAVRAMVHGGRRADLDLTRNSQYRNLLGGTGLPRGAVAPLFSADTVRE